MLQSQEKAKILGSGYFFNFIADSFQNLLSLESLNGNVAIAETACTVTVDAGTTNSKLYHFLHQKGLTLRNLGSLPQIWIAGAINTTTHESGEKSGNLATSDYTLALLTAEGEDQRHRNPKKKTHDALACSFAVFPQDQ